MMNNEETRALSEKYEAKIAQLERVVGDEKGKAIAATRERDQVKREAEKTKNEAAAYRVETDNMIATASDQLKQAFAISTAIFHLGQWGIRTKERSANAMRALHREEQFLKLIEAMIDAYGSSDKAAFTRLADQGSRWIKIIRGNIEAHRLRIEALNQLDGEKEISEALKAAITPKHEFVIE